jgi:hypothetical protein
MTRGLLHPSSGFPFFFFLLVGFLPNLGRAEGIVYPIRFKTSPDLAIIDVGSWRMIRRGIELRKVRLERSEPYYQVDLKLVRFDARWIVPRVLRSAQFNLKGTDVKTLAEKSGAIAAINANYFDEKGKPLGFLKLATNDIYIRVSKSSLFTGIFGVKNHLPLIFHRDQFSPDQVDEGLQAGPLLLLRGTALHVTRGAGKQSRRSLVGIDKDQRAIIAVTDGLLGGLSWVEVQEFFSSEQWQVYTPDLVNLDGGGSAQLYARGIQIEEHVPGSTHVPVALGFFPKGE